MAAKVLLGLGEREVCNIRMIASVKEFLEKVLQRRKRIRTSLSRVSGVGYRR